MCYSVYDATELENATTPSLVKPISRGCEFITNKWFNSYDTFAVVDKLQKKCEEKDFITEKEIVESRGITINENGYTPRKSTKKR